MMRFVRSERLMSDDEPPLLTKISKEGSQYSTENDTNEWRYIITEFGSSCRPQHSASPFHAPQLEAIFTILLC